MRDENRGADFVEKGDTGVAADDLMLSAVGDELYVGGVVGVENRVAFEAGLS